MGQRLNGSASSSAHPISGSSKKSHPFKSTHIDGAADAMLLGAFDKLGTKLGTWLADGTEEGSIDGFGEGSPVWKRDPLQVQHA